MSRVMYLCMRKRPASGHVRTFRGCEGTRTPATFAGTSWKILMRSCRPARERGERKLSFETCVQTH